MTLKTPRDDEDSTQIAQALTSSTHETLRAASNTQAYDDGVRVDGKVWMKLDLLILPLVTVMAFVYLLIRYARIVGFTTDISNEKFSVAITLGTLPTILLQIPATHLMLYLGARYQFPAMAILTGVAVILQGYSLECFHMLQFRLSILSTALPLALAFSGLLAYPITRINGIYGRPGWAWLFILEGGLAIFWGLVFVLTKTEKQLVRRALEQDQLSHKLDSHGNLWRNMRSTLVRPYVLLISLASFFLDVAFIGLGIFLPTIVVGLGYDPSEAQIKLMSVPPYAIAVVVSIGSSIISDRYAIRGPMIAVLAILSTAGLATNYLATSVTGAFLLAVPCMFGIQPALPAWLANNTPQLACRTIAVAFAGVLTLAGNILSVWLFGPVSPPPKYESATVVLMALQVGILGCAVGTMVYVAKENRKKARAREAYASAQMVNGAAGGEGLGIVLAEDKGEMTNDSIWYKYIMRFCSLLYCRNLRFPLLSSASSLSCLPPSFE
ncbi:major facilitator superfamily domain-containing protein [Fomes fomentarius]|nr:major facilitator superfamily domain-containing protein [Fomes fomentarius]